VDPKAGLETWPIHVLGSFLTHHQEAESVMWRKVIVFLPNRLSAGLAEKVLQPVDSDEKQVPFATLHTRLTDDGLKMSLKHVEAW
jgi:hypothetical protein